MKKLLIPFISRIKQPQKFVLISLLFVLPFAVVIYYGYSDTEERINFVRKEKAGVLYIQTLKALLQNTQQDRGMSNAYLSGDASFKEKLEKIHRRMRDDIKAVDEIEKKYGETLDTAKAWNKIKEKWQEFEERESSMTPKESFDAHTELIADILSLIFHVTNTSMLILDPYYDSYYMMDISSNRIPLLTEELGKIRGLGAGAIASGAITPHEKIQLLKISYSIKPAIDAIERNMQIIYKENPSLKPRLEDSFKDAIASTNEFIVILNDRIIGAERTDIKPEEYFSLTTTAIDANFRLFDVLSQSLDGVLQARIDKFTRERYYIGTSLFVLFVLYFSIALKFKNSLTRQLSAENELRLAVSFNEQVEQWLQHRFTMEEAIAKVSRLFISPIEDVDLEYVLKIIGEAISVKRAVVFKISEDKRRMDKILQWSAAGTAPIGDNFKHFNPDMLQWSMKKFGEGENIIISDVDSLPPEACAERDIFRSVNIKSLIAVPIKSITEGFIGFIGFDDTEKCRRWLKEDAYVLRVVAEMVGIYWHHRKMDEQIKTSLKEKEILLKEIHHRVKNNLQIISSLFSLQSSYIKDKQQALDILNDSQSRIKSIAIVHEKLYKSKDLSRINFTEYIKDLTDNIFRSYRVNSDAVALIINAEDIYFDVDTAIPLGLIINELVLNSIKYAFPPPHLPSPLRGEAGLPLPQSIAMGSGEGHRGNEIAIDLRHENGRYTLIISDNGVGFPEGLDFHNTKSLGLQLVNTLTEQLNGKIEMDRKNGTVFKITFQK